MLESVKWLFFDMGSTLLDETDSYKSWFANAANLVNGAISAEDIEKEYCAGMARYEATVVGQLKQFGFTGNSTNHLYPSELDKPYPEAKAVLERLSKSYHLGIIANQKHGAEQRLEGYGIRQFFDVIISSAETGFVKPDPRIFELAFQQAECKPDEAVMIGDRPDNDIYPAKRIGMKTIRIKQGYAACQEPRSEEYEADITIGSLGELPAVLQSPAVNSQ